MRGMVAMGRIALAGHIRPSSPHWTAATGGLASAVVPAALPGQTQIGIPGTHTYGYDALGRRVSKTVNGVTRVYINNADWQEVAEYQGTAGVPPAQPGTAGFQPALVQSYVFGTYIDEVLCMVKPDGQRYWYSTNDLYSVYALTDGTGTVVERYIYDPYGGCTILAPDGVTVRPESLYGNTHTFTGRTEDKETGLFNFRNRMYSTELGRFVSRDPIGYVDGFGLYGAYFVPSAHDPQGTWVIIRNHEKRRASAVPSRGDTIAGLAPMAKLDVAQYTKWLDMEAVPVCPASADDAVRFKSDGTPCCKFTVPNVFVMGTSYSQFSVSTPFLNRWVSQVGKAAIKQGLYVRLYIKTTLTYPGIDNTSAGLRQALSSRDTWGYAFFGHGIKYYLDAEMRNTNGSFVWDHATDDYINPGWINNPFRYGLGINYHCYADEQPWTSLISANGKYYGSSGWLSAMSGPRGVGYWGSWDSLITEAVK